jgi:hypothetical protein
MRKLREEIDDIIGDQPAQYQDLSKMHYLHGLSRFSSRIRHLALIEPLYSRSA